MAEKKITLESNNERYFCVTRHGVKVYPELVYPFEWHGHKFFAHGCLKRGGGFKKRLFNATDVKTGAAVGYCYLTPMETVKQAKAKLTKMGEEAYERKVAACPCPAEAV